MDGRSRDGRARAPFHLPPTCRRPALQLRPRARFELSAIAQDRGFALIPDALDSVAQASGRSPCCLSRAEVTGERRSRIWRGVSTPPPDKEARTRDALLGRIADEIIGLGAESVTRVAIDGVDGAGKTTFAKELGAVVERMGRPVIRVSADDFLNPRSVRYRFGRTSPDGFFLDSYDYEALRRYVLEPLGPGGSGRIRRRAFDLSADAPIEAVEETPAANAILILDGLFLHRDELAEVWDFSIFLDVAFSVSIGRCATRGTSWTSPDVDAPSNRRYVVGQRLYLARCAPQRRATLVIDNNDLAAPAIKP